MTRRRSPSSTSQGTTSQGTTSPLTQDQVIRRGTERIRGTSRRSFTTTATPPVLHQEMTTMTHRKIERLIKTTLLTILACRTILMLICYQFLLEPPPPTLMEKIILSGVIKCVVNYFLSILASEKLLKMECTLIVQTMLFL
jgi:hypothetical protein